MYVEEHVEFIVIMNEWTMNMDDDQKQNVLHLTQNSFERK